MWECNFAGERMDYKLFWLRFVKKIWLILATAVLGALLIGGSYYLVNITFGEEPSYKVVSQLYLDYAEDGSGTPYEFINYFTWSEIVNTDEFIAILKEQVSGMSVSDEKLRAYTDATVESDVRYLYTTVTTETPDTSLQLARAMEEAVKIFVKGQKEFNSAKVVTMPLEATETYPDVRPVRAVVLGMVLGLFVGLVGVSVQLICDSSVFLPSTLEKRYQTKALGCVSFTESKNNIRYLIKGAKKLAVVGLGELDKVGAMDAVKFIKGHLEDDCDACVMEKSVISEDFDFDALRECDKLVLLVRAGAKNGKLIERAVEQIRRQDLEIGGAFLFDEDKKLIKQYYR